MALAVFHGQTLTVSIKDASAVEQAVAVTKGVTIRAEFDRQVLFGQGSVLRQAVSRINHRVTVSVKYAKFSGKLISAILDESLADTDIDGNAAVGRTQSKTKDSTVPPLFTITGTVTSTDGTETYKVKVENVDWQFTENLPEGDWVTKDLEGEGDRLLIERATT